MGKHFQIGIAEKVQTCFPLNSPYLTISIDDTIA